MNDVSPLSPSSVEWVKSAVGMPLAFAQVREDPALDRWLLAHCADQFPDGLDILQIASGGCTAALLATAPRVRRIHAVDASPAQIALTRLKIWLLRHAEPCDRLAILGHSELPAAERSEILREIFSALELSDECLGPLETISKIGPDHSGRYEMLFGALRQHLQPWKDDLQAFLELQDPTEQSAFIAAESPLGRALDEAFAEVMALDHLIRLFGQSATGNAIQPFARHFVARLRHVAATLPAATNPYLWSLLAGRYPTGHPVDWLKQSRRAHVPQITSAVTTMDVALRNAQQRYHVIHLSNILDWLSGESARQVLDLAWSSLHPGGLVIIRQLNSSLDIPGLESRFAWQKEDGEALHDRDRSFFYRAIHVGQKS